ncbi:hypothetical protein CEP52_010706 [Fusarium oligoseptatum]|uniref:Uncharacterized protein n=1 Tax=Fusarium oligoseptatum TaxID=2604345 RepID=A0A428T6Y5_9HYPO|nr:hypothetical protein CEP52_010706 [Fusarium oligoseptatum]
MVLMTRNLQAQITTVVVGDDDTRGDRPPASRILCVRTIQQTRTNELGVPELLKVLPDDEHWVGCLVPANQLEPDGSCEHLPLHVVGNTPDGKSYVVAVASSRVQVLRDLLFSFSLAPRFGPDGSEPIKAEVAVYGIAQARQKSQSRYVEKAIRGVLSSQHQGLGRYYQRNTRNQRLRLPIDCAILTRDVEGASPEVRSHFHNLCCFLALHLLSDINAILGDIFGVELTEPVSFGRCRTSRARQDPAGASDSDVRQDLSEASYKTKDPLGYIASKCGQRSVTDLQDRVARYLPVWFFNPVYEALPADLINALSYEAVTGAQTMRFHASCKNVLAGKPRK